MPTVSAAISPVMWCGSNSILRRAKAANDLKIQLESLTGEDPILIIGHSHGGNVVLQAASKLRDLSNIYVCTLATPFFRLFESDRRFAGARTLLTIFSIAACIPVAIVIYALVMHFAAEKLALADDTAASILALFVIAAFFAGAIGGGRLFELLVNPVRARTLCAATFADAKSLGSHLLVLRGIDDEAALSLAAGAVANRVLRIAYSFTLRLMIPFSKLDVPRIADQVLAWFGPPILATSIIYMLFGPHITFVGLTILFVLMVSSPFFNSLNADRIRKRVSLRCNKLYCGF